MPRYVSMKSMSIHHEIPEIYRVKRALTDVDHIANEFYEAVLDLDPVIATEQGRTGVATQFRDYSPAGEEAYIQLVRATLKKLDQVIPIDDVDLVTLDAMQERLGLSLESHRAGLGGWQLNNIVSVPQEIRGGFDLMARNTEQDWANIAGRLFNVPQAITGFVQTLHTARVAGHVSPRRQIEIVIEQIAEYIAEDGFFDELAAEITQAVPDLAEQARRGAKAAKDGYATLKTYLHEVLLPAAPQQDAVGRKLYALHSRASLGASVDLDETYAWGVQELDRIIAQQRQVAEEIEPGASIERAKEILDADPSCTEPMRSASGCSRSRITQCTSSQVPSLILTVQCCVWNAASPLPMRAVSITLPPPPIFHALGACGGLFLRATIHLARGARLRRCTTRAFRGIICRRLLRWS